MVSKKMKFGIGSVVIGIFLIVGIALLALSSASGKTDTNLDGKWYLYSGTDINSEKSMYDTLSSKDYLQFTKNVVDDFHSNGKNGGAAYYIKNKKLYMGDGICSYKIESINGNRVLFLTDIGSSMGGEKIYDKEGPTTIYVAGENLDIDKLTNLTNNREVLQEVIELTGNDRIFYIIKNLNNKVDTLINTYDVIEKSENDITKLYGEATYRIQFKGKNDEGKANQNEMVLIYLSKDKSSTATFVGIKDGVASKAFTDELNTLDVKRVENIVDTVGFKYKVVDTNIIPNGGEYKVYSLDINTDDEIILSTLAFSNNVTTLEDKLQKLALYMSDVKFSGLPIEIVKIEEVDGKKIATINLEEEAINENEENWNNYIGENWFDYCSGSAGGHNTSYSLIKTLLQPEYSGEWIDGVVFQYKGENIPFQHAEGLSRISYREDSMQ